MLKHIIKLVYEETEWSNRLKHSEFDVGTHGHIVSNTFAIQTLGEYGLLSQLFPEIWRKEGFKKSDLKPRNHEVNVLNLKW